VSERMPRAGNFAAKWIGTLEIENAGLYTFGLTSDDGSRLWINNQMIVNNGGYHAALKKVCMYAGMHVCLGFS
jgi:beta-glucosidase